MSMKSKSSKGRLRSPVPPSSTPQLQDQSRFFPPSYYAAAAAAGLQSFAGSHSRDDAVHETAMADSSIPVAYPYDSGSDTPVSGSRGLSGNRTRAGSISSKKSFQSSSSGQSDRSYRRQTQLESIEAQLLPSLRDTIDRMTHPAVPSSPRAESTLSPQPQTHSTPGRLHRSPYLDTSHVSSPRTPTLAPEATPSPNVVSSSTPRMPTPKARPISILKSTPDLRSNLNSSTPKQSYTSGTESPRSKSLRSARHISTRPRPALDSIEPTDTFSTSVEESHESPFPVSVKADVSLENAYETTTHSRVRTISAVDSPTPHRSKSRITVGAGMSHLPRRLPEQRIPIVSRRHNLIGGKRSADESSSSEIEYDGEGRNNRILVVANAEVVPSSSSESNGSSGGGSKSRLQSRLPVFSGKNVPWSPRQSNGKSSTSRGAPIGLGINIRDVRHSHSFAPEEHYIGQKQRGQDEDEASIYEDEADIQTLDGQVRWDEDGGHSGSEQDHSEGQQDVTDDEQTRRRRQQALVNIVDGLESAGTLAGVGNAMLHGPSASASGTSGSWHGGIAISGSKDFDGQEQIGFSSNDDLAKDAILSRIAATSGDDSVSNSDYSDDDDPPAQDPTQGNNICGEELTRSAWNSPVHRAYSESPVNGDRIRGRPSSKSIPDRSSRTSRPLSLPAAPSRPARPEESLYSLHNHDHKSSIGSPTSRGIGNPRPSESRRSSIHRHSMASGSPSHLRSLSARREEVLSVRDRPPSRLRSSSALGNIGMSTRTEADFYDGSGVISKSDSYTSSVGEVHRWREQGDVFSHGAEALFEQLQSIRSQSRRSEHRNSQSAAKRQDRFLSAGNLERVRSSPDLKSRESLATPHQQSKATQDTDSYENGEIDQRRQRVFRELCDSEQAFLAQIRPIVAHFIQPLRSQNRKSWINGVPSELAPFFDWFEDIVNLHTQLWSILRSIRKGGKETQEQTCQTILRFVPKLEVYQPYIVQARSAFTLIDEMVLDKQSDFGEFLRIQQRQAGISRSSFERMLFKPRERLDYYATVFQELFEATPKTHVDYLPAFSLVSSTRVIINAMLEVKDREDEYHQVKGLLSQIDGIPASASLAQRERRLLAHGSLCLLEYNPTGQSSGVSIGSSHVLDDKNLPLSSKANLRQSRLGSAVLEWGNRRSRSRSTDSAVSSLLSFDSASSGFRAPELSSSGSYSESKTLFSPSPARPRKDCQQTRCLQAESLHSETPIPVLALVFTDLLILATPVSDREQSDGGGDPDRWFLLHDIGMARILQVEPISEVENLNVAVDLVPLDVKQLETGEIPVNASVVTIRLVSPIPGSRQENFTPWLDALRQCSKHMLRSLSFPTHSGKYLAPGSGVDLEGDTRQAIMSILASGLPMPKSPSVQISDLPPSQNVHLGQLERESRGWWTIRFEQVYREMQRTDE